LQSLNLRNNNLGVEGGTAVAEALKVNSSLQNLNLESNMLTLQGGRAVAEALKVNSSLQTCLLGKNNLGTQGGKELVAEVRKARPSVRIFRDFRLYDGQKDWRYW
jgi:Ran GTPase-activating protein (RanGAP) involved in mRNA processing and transport